ncbi:MAG: FAD-binding protein [Acidobacteriota bacterium]|nr:FAD-binding protein [Acidobacteriota bacterium]
MSLKTDLRSLQEGGEPEIHERVDLRAWTALGVGGLADILIRCRSADGLQRALDLLATYGRDWLFLGSGSRLVPSDYGLRVPVLNLSGNLGLWELDVDGAVAWSGANLAQVCRAAARSGLGGFEALMAASGTVGGAIEAAQRGHFPLRGFLQWTDVARPGNPVERVQSTTWGEQHRGLTLDLERKVILRARLKLSTESLKTLRIRFADGTPNRWQRQPRTAGPVFVGPEGVRAEVVLAETGCLGMSVGSARLCENSPNRIRTSRSARAAEVLELTQRVRDRVMDKTGVQLEPALCFVDEHGVKVDL